MRHTTLAEAVASRILVLDGAMGTMIQKYGLSEADFRGERFADSDVLQKGNYDIEQKRIEVLAVLTLWMMFIVSICVLVQT